MRCGKKLVRMGDTKAYVIETCRAPLSDDLVAYKKARYLKWAFKF